MRQQFKQISRQRRATSTVPNQRYCFHWRQRQNSIQSDDLQTEVVVAKLDKPDALLFRQT